MAIRRPLTTKQRYKKYGKNWNEVWACSQVIPMFGHDVRVHKKVVSRVEAWEHRVREHERVHALKPWKPKVIMCGNWRSIIGRKTRSLHSWMIAWDIDPAQNPLGSRRNNIPLYVRKAASASGIQWGGGWLRRDPMHWQYPY